MFTQRSVRTTRTVAAMGATLVSLTACTPKENPMSHGDLTSFATQYAAAWSGKDPVAFAAFYDENGSLIVNGSASVGRAAITETAGALHGSFSRYGRQA